MSKILLITDHAGVSEASAGLTPIVMRLDTLRDLDVAISSITCDVVLRGFDSMERLRTALKRYRTDASIPLIFLIADGDILTYALANALGATEIRSTRTTSSVVGALHDPRPIDSTVVVSPSEPAPPLEQLVETVASSLKEIFERTEKQQRLSSQNLCGGADALLLAIKESCISDWIGVVRGYDDATYQHCLLVAGLVARFTAHLGMSFKAQHLLAQAALMHDIGKSKVPYAILNKAGPLTDAEQQVMRRHPATGYYMIAHQSGIDPCVLDIVRHHHEFIDGSGYPDRLRGDQISEFCRLVTICDIYAALIERRSYKQPMLPRDAFAILVGMGHKLDARLVEDFRALVDEMATPSRSAAA